MKQGVYKLAGHNIGIDSLYEAVHKLCREYSSNAQPEFWIQTEEKDIREERKKAADTDKREGRTPQSYPDSYLETLAVYRKIAEQLLQKNIFLMHGSVVAVDGEGYLFTAKSGTGKSTHTKLWMEQFGERAVMVNDDKPLIEVRESGIVVYGTPWDGKHHRSTNIGVPLKAVCQVKRGEKNRIETVSKKELYPVLMQQSYRPESAVGLTKTMELIEAVAQRSGLYVLHCNMEPEAALLAYERMK